MESPEQTTPELPRAEMVAVTEPIAEPRQRRPRPEPNLIYHMSRPESYAPGSVVPAGYVATNALRQVTPRSEPKRLPADGWYAAGGPPPKPIAEAKPPVTPPVSTQLAHPQPFERPRQIILEWSGETIRR